MTPLERYRRLQLDRQRLLANLAEERSRLAGAEEELRAAQEAQELLQATAAQVQRSAHDKLAGVVSRCLESVFGTVYDFSIDFERKRQGTEARLRFVKGGNEISPRDGLGGGVLDVAGFALRVAALSMSKPPVRKFLAADEPFRHVSKEYRPKVRALLEALSSEAKIQMLIVTHYEAFEAGTVVEVT